MKKIRFENSGHVWEPENNEDTLFIKKAIKLGLLKVAPVKKWTIATVDKSGCIQSENIYLLNL